MANVLVVGASRGIGLETVRAALRAGHGVRYSLLNHEPLKGDFAELQERNVSIIAGGVYNSGILATGVKEREITYDYQAVPETIINKVQAIESVCYEYGVPLASAAIEFVSMHPAVATVVLGAKSVEEVEQNLASMANPAPREFWAELKQKGLVPDNAPTA
jgi:D-threo-aldose 1-dehydrogenase